VPHVFIIHLLLIPRVKRYPRPKLWLGSAGLVFVVLAMILPPMPQGKLQLFPDITYIFRQALTSGLLTISLWY
jgi:hypothetical protein